MRIYTGEELSLDLSPEGLAWLRIDQPGVPYNTLGARLHRELAAALEAIAVQSGARAILLCSGKPDFVVGADISEFAALFALGPEAIVADNLALNTGASRLADQPLPVVSVIGGMAFGGGLELALCADARVVGEAAQLGLPEVTLGLMPGLGGTVRTPRLTGLAVAAEMITGGRPISAARAVEVGLADAIRPPEALEAAAAALALRLAADPAALAALRARHRGPVPGGHDLTAQRRELEKRVAPHQPAAFEALGHLERSASVSRDVALGMETETFARISQTQAADALSGAFFASRKVAKQAREAAKGAAPVAGVLVLGAGIMGTGIAWSAARAGKQVYLHDLEPAALERALEEGRRLTARETERGRLDVSGAAELMARIIPVSRRDAALASADLVIEAVTERFALKCSLLAEIAPQLRPDAVLATNTSSLRVSDLARGLSVAPRLVGLHFFNPVAVMPLVEVIRTPQAEASALASAVAFVLALRKTPVLVADAPGFVVNRLLTVYMRAFCDLLAEGVDFRRIDAVAEAWGWPMGPAALQDVVGMDTSAQVLAQVEAGYTGRMPAGRGSAIADLAAAGFYGQKSGAGFYSYQRGENGRLQRRVNPAAEALIGATPGAQIADEDILRRLMGPLLAEAARILDEGGVASAEDLDQAMCLGAGFPAFAGGPLRLADWLAGARAAGDPLQGLMPGAPRFYR